MHSDSSSHDPDRRSSSGAAAAAMAANSSNNGTNSRSPSCASSSNHSSNPSHGLGAPTMDRALPHVPVPPFIALPRDQAFISIGGERPKRRRPASPNNTSLNGSTNNDGDANGVAGTIGPSQDDPGDEEQEYYDDNDDGEPVSPPAWPYQLSHAAHEFIMERPDPEMRSFAHRLPNADRIREHFRAGGKLSLDDAMWIIQSAQMVLLEEANVLELRSPITVCGDVHGQFFDLLTLLDLGGSPTDPANPTQYLFLGDYVDRGCFSTEVALLLLSYKLLRPQHMWLLRGNHECRHLTAYFNFKIECCKKYSEAVYDAFMNCFDALPLAARIDGSFLCVHGGLGPDIRSVEDIQLIQRVQEPPPRGPMCDLLWADPMEPDEESAAPGARYLYNDIRSCSYSFSYKATLEFLRANNLYALIRAHESQFEGYRMFQKVPETGMPSVICIFSAPNYCEYNNKAAILQLADHSIRVRQFAAVEHPYVLQNFLNAFTWSVPFLVDKLQHIITEVANTTPMDPVTYAAEMAKRQQQQQQQHQQQQLESDGQEKSGSGAVAAVIPIPKKKLTGDAAAAAAEMIAAGGGAADDDDALSMQPTTVGASVVSSAPTTVPAAEKGVSNSSIGSTRPLLHALRAAGGAKAMARDALAAHQQQLRTANGSLGSLDGLLSLAMKMRAFLLLPRFLRRRGRIVLIKLRAVVWFRLHGNRRKAG